LSIPVYKTLFSGDPGDMKAVRLNQIADDCIEVTNHCGEQLNIFLSHRKQDSPHPKKYLNDLVRTICETVDEGLKETSETFMHKILSESLAESHGCLIAVCRTPKLPKFLSDGVPFSPPIDFADEIKNCRDKGGALSTSILKSHALLLKGTLSCDGIVVFTRDAKLLAYRCFLSLSPQEANTEQGGARSRAFNSLCVKINRGVFAAFIQSQDGYTDFRRVENGPK
jgi:hypothetical protein